MSSRVVPRPPRVVREPSVEGSEAMQRICWVLVAGAFLVWVALAVVAVRWLSGMLLTAAVTAPSTLELVSGIVLHREPNQTTELRAQPGMQVYERDELVTAIGSTARLHLFDGTVFEMFPEARLQVNATRLGRVNPAATQAMFTLVDGAVRLEIPNREQKAHTVNVITPHGAAAFVPGSYTLRVGPEGTRISVSAGRTAAAVADAIIEIGRDQKIVLHPDRVTYTVIPRLEDVLANGSFAQGYDGWHTWDDGEEGRPDAPGRRVIVPGEGEGAPRQALRVSRASVIDAHNETGLRQFLGRDVSGARQVEIRARLRVDFASLSGGGYLGSEYPLMIRLRYRDGRGVDHIWTQGFYYANPENRPIKDARRVPRGEWTEFRFDLAALDRPPVLLDAIEVFGAGHTFDAQVGDVQLLVD